MLEQNMRKIASDGWLPSVGKVLGDDVSWIGTICSNNPRVSFQVYHFAHDPTEALDGAIRKLDEFARRECQ